VREPLVASLNPCRLPDVFAFKRFWSGRKADREADTKTNGPREPPAKFKRIPANPVVLKQQAEELAKLSAEIPSQIDQVGQGKIP
jgi:hypothetical protein